MDEIRGGWETIYAKDLRKYWWVFHDFKEYFSLIKIQMSDSVLSGEQKLVLVSLIEIAYERRLATSRIGYQEMYKNMFEYSEDAKDERPELLKVIDSQLVEIQKLRQAAEDQLAIEQMPVVDEE